MNWNAVLIAVLVLIAFSVHCTDVLIDPEVDLACELFPDQKGVLCVLGFSFRSVRFAYRVVLSFFIARDYASVLIQNRQLAAFGRCMKVAQHRFGFSDEIAVRQRMAAMTSGDYHSCSGFPSTSSATTGFVSLCESLRNRRDVTFRALFEQARDTHRTIESGCRIPYVICITRVAIMAPVAITNLRPQVLNRHCWWIPLDQRHNTGVLLVHFCC
jgi:hypothetical protein